MLKRLFYVISLTLFLCPGMSIAQQKADSVIRKGKADSSLVPTQLKEVEVKGRTQPVNRTSISSTLTRQQMESSQGGNLAEVLKDIAGVSMLKSGSTISKPVIHGLHSNRILILNNGIRLEGQQWGAEHAPEIDPFIAERMQVIKGAESVRFGAEALGGVVVVTPPALPEDPKVLGALSLVGASNGRSGTSSAMLNGGLKSLPGFGWRVQGTLKKAGNIRTADYYLGNTGLREQNFSAALGYGRGNALYEVYYSRFSTDLGILYSAHAGTKEDIEARIAIGRPLEDYGFTYKITAPRQEITHDLLKLKAHYDLQSGKSLDVVYGFQRNHRKEFDFRRGDREALPITDLVLNTHTLDLSFEQKLDNGSKRLYGFNGVVQVNNNIPGTLATTFIPNYDSFTGGLFLMQRWVKDAVEWEAGIRYDFKTFNAAGFRYQYNTSEELQENGVKEEYYGGQNRFHNVTGSLGGLWKINSSWQLTTNIGVAWRAPTANELFSNGLHHGAGLFEIGNANIKAEQGYKWVSSIRHFAGRLNFNLDAYAQYIHGYIYTQPDQTFRQTVSGTYPIFRYQQTNASFFGADLSGSYQLLSSLSYQLNAAVVRAKDLSKRKYLPYIPSDRIDQGLRWELDAKKSNSYFQLGHSFVARQSRYEPGSDYAAPPAAYHLVKLMAGTRIKLNTQELGLSFSVDNLFNTSYKEYMNRYRYYTHDMGRNMTIRMNYKF